MVSKKPSDERGISRRAFLAAAGSVPLAAALAGNVRAQDASVSRPNILIIIADQLAQKAVGVYGNRDVRTPRIDDLARGGVRFSKAYTSCPLCQPARASMWTSLYPHQTGVNSNGMNYPVPSVSERTPTLGQVFSAAGYDAVNFGKQHDAGALRGFRLVGEEEQDLDAPAAWPVNADSKRDVPTTSRTVEYLLQQHDKPFIAITSLNNPHNICGWVGEFEGEHSDLPLPGGALPPLPDNFEIKDLESRPLPVQYICCSHRRLRQAARWNEDNYRHYLAAYYHYTNMADRQVGEILDALQSTPAGKNTIVVFLSDHGDGMGSHRMVTKQVSFYEETTRVPFVFAGPGLARPGSMVADPVVSTLDLFPTLCDLAGLETPAGLQGISLAPWLRGESKLPQRDYIISEWETEWGYTVSPGRMLRSGDFKYTYYLEGGGEELYDLNKDPGEKRNLIRDKAYRKQLEQHREMLKAHVKASRDPFFGQGVKVDPRWRSHKLGYQNHEGPCAPEAAWEEAEKNGATK